MRIFEYTFYRIAEYYKKKGNSSASSFASSAITVLQCFLILDVLIIARIFYEYPIPSSFNKFWALPVAIVLGVLNWCRYERNGLYKEVRKKWKNEHPQQKKKRGILVVVGLIVVILTPILYGLIRQNIIDGKSFFN